MEIFGVGPSELVFIILIAIIILGPKDMQKAGRTIGRFLNQLVRSDSWKVFQKTSAELRNLPRNLMREANMELQEVNQEIQQSIDPRSRPSAFTASQNPSTVSTAPTASDSEPMQGNEADLPPSSAAESPEPAEPPTVKPIEDNTDKHD